jgi:hypothetical protein
MPIRHYLQGHRFAPETACLLGVAFEMALVTLQHADGPVARPETPVAQKIIELAKAGERDPKRLCDGGDHVNQQPQHAITPGVDLVFLRCRRPKEKPRQSGA